MGPNDKRQRRRLNVNIPVVYTSVGSAPCWGESLTSDLSAMGARLKLDFFAPPRSQFSLKIRIPEVQRIVETQARVAWAAPLAHSDKYQVGFEFMEMSPIFRKWIEEYILVNETLNRP